MEFEKTEIQPKTLIETIQYYLAGVLLLTLFGIVLYVVVMRYYFSRPPIWGEDVPRTLFVWLTFLSAGIAIRLGLNIRVTSFVNMMSPGVRRVVETVMHLIVLGMLGVFFWFSFPIIELGWGGRMLSTGWSEAVLSLPLPLGAAIMAYYQSLRLVDLWRQER
jgi:TRAP-type C4-dicarboxylate transport system permease small subunit